MWSRNWSGRVLPFIVVCAAALVCGACIGTVSSSSVDALPRLSFVGVPDRDISFELRITGHDMDPMVHTGISRSSGELRLSVPAGRDRVFSLIAENDVYAGHSVVSLAGGHETRVRIPVHPGPVFVSERWGMQEVEPGLIQIRDLNVDVAGLYDETDGTIRFLPEGEDFYPIAAQYGADGALWVMTRIGDVNYTVERWTQWGDRPDSPISIEADDASCFAVDSSRGIFTVWSATTTSEPVLYTLTGNLIPQSFVPHANGDPGDFHVTSMTGLSFDRNGNLWGLGLVEDFDGETFTEVPSIIQFDRSSGLIYHEPLPGTHYVAEVYYAPWGDIHASDTDVYVVIASYPPEAGSVDFGLGNPDALNDVHHPVLYRYNLAMELQQTWGRRITHDSPVRGEFWGPRQFVTTRNARELIIIDQKDFEDDDYGMAPNLDGQGRILRFQPGEAGEWQDFGTGAFGFFNTEVYISGAAY